MYRAKVKRHQNVRDELLRHEAKRLNYLRRDLEVTSLVKALRILLASRDCLAPDGSPEIPEHISASFDIGLDEALFISKLELP